MAKARTNRAAWVIAVLLAVVVLGGVALLGVQLKPYWVAKYRGNGANLDGAVLIFPPLPGADLMGASLSGANLDSVDLRHANLSLTTLSDASLRGADLSRADLSNANADGSDLRRADLTRVTLTGALYDASTRWPAGFDPIKHGMVLVE